MKFTIKLATLAALALTTAIPLSAHAHRGWLLPSMTVISGDKPWVTVDAAISNDLFYFEHFPMRLDGLTIVAPDGKPAQAQNSATGRYRSTFDVELTQGGTYKIAVINQGLFASYKLDGKPQRWRGSADKLSEIPANAQDLQVSQTQGRNETFVTVGKPSRVSLATSGSGLELDPLTHPNDLFSGDSAEFRLLLDGQPAAGVEVEIVPGGNRYRDQLNDWKIKTNQEGKFSVKWPNPGMYWIEASVRDDKATKPATTRRATYVATFEVLPQ